MYYYFYNLQNIYVSLIKTLRLYSIYNKIKQLIFTLDNE